MYALATHPETLYVILFVLQRGFRAFVKHCCHVEIHNNVNLAFESRLSLKTASVFLPLYSSSLKFALTKKSVFPKKWINFSNILLRDNRVWKKKRVAFQIESSNIANAPYIIRILFRKSAVISEQNKQLRKTDFYEDNG